LLHAQNSNADPIRSFEITPETLAIHCGLGLEHAHAAEEAFRLALKTDPYLLWSLQNRKYHAATADVPNCMAMLALSLLVDSLLDGKYANQGQYRAKLAQWLDIDRSFTKLIGIATMWEELVEWLDERIAAGAPFRKLILPTPPRSWTNIGYTRYLSFPTKRDIALLRKLVEKQPKAAEDASTLVRLLDPLVRSSTVSIGLNLAFQDFRKALRAGQASSDHRFWKLVARARALAGHVEAPPLRCAWSSTRTAREAIASPSDRGIRCCLRTSGMLLPPQRFWTVQTSGQRPVAGYCSFDQAASPAGPQPVNRRRDSVPSTSPSQFGTRGLRGAQWPGSKQAATGTSRRSQWPPARSPTSLVG
jgi:hypothetical protein